MKKSLFTIALAVLGLTACDNFHTSGNGKLDGFWQMTHVDTLSTGNTADVTSQMIFWAVQSELIELSNRQQSVSSDLDIPPILFRFERADDKLILLGDPKPRVSSRKKSDSDFASAPECGYYGLSERGDTLRILQLEKEKMTLESEKLRMYFRKY